MQTLCGRADLLRLLAEAPTANAESLASLLGYVRRDPRPDLSHIPPLHSEASVDLPAPAPAPSEEVTANFDIPFWQPVRREFTPDAVPLDAPSPPIPDRFALKAEPATRWPDQPTALPPWPSLTPRPAVLTRLRSPLGRPHPSGGVDIAAATQRLARAQQIGRLPRRPVRRWGSAVQILDDRSRRLTPFWSDQDEVRAWLSDLYPHSTVTHGRYFEGLTEPLLFDAQGALVEDYALPPPGTSVLVLGDLGCLDAWPTTRRFWLQFGHKLRAAGCHPIALLPCGPDHWPADLAHLWTMVDWEQFHPRSATDAPSTEASVERLLCLLSPAIRVEPGLLRQIRRLPSAGNADASSEAAFWQHSAISSPSSVAASFDPDAANARRGHFAEVPDDERAEVLACIRTWRATLSPDVWFEEILSLNETKRTGISDADIDAAHTRFHNLSLNAVTDPRHSAALAAGVRGLLRRLPPDVPADLRPVADRFWAFLQQNDWAPAEKPPWGGIDPTHVPPTLDHPARWSLYQQGNALHVVREAKNPFILSDSLLSGGDVFGGEQPKAAARVGSLITDITSRNGFVTIAGRGHYLHGDALSIPLPPVAPLVIATDQETLSLDRLTQPSWADAIGRDRYGLWARFTVKGVSQRLRWIPPGRFLMGSPADKKGEYEDEGPRRLVVIDKGFWLFDTPCSLALWRAVMERKPSKIRGDLSRVMKTVGRGDVFRFLELINVRIPGLNLALPSPVQWEYACRPEARAAISRDINSIGSAIIIEDNYKSPAIMQKDKAEMTITQHGSHGKQNFRKDSIIINFDVKSIEKNYPLIRNVSSAIEKIVFKKIDEYPRVLSPIVTKTLHFAVF